jgi:hypothetical protein
VQRHVDPRGDSRRGDHSLIFDEPFADGDRSVLGEIVDPHPVRRRAQVSEQSCRSEDDRSGAHRRRVLRRRVHGCDPLEQPRVLARRSFARAARHDDDVRARHFVERAVGDHRKRSALRADFTLLFGNEDDLGPWKPCKDVIRPDGVERRDAFI